MLNHPTITKLDLSNNDISLVAGLAILSLLQHNPHIVQVNLEGTQMPEGILKKITRTIEKNKANMSTSGDNTSVAEADVEGKAIEGSGAEKCKDDCEQEANLALAQGIHQTSSFASTMRETMRKAEWVRNEVAAIERLTRIANCSAAAESKFVPWPHVDSGWRLLEVAILAPPFIFHSEIELLLNQVFPRLNKEFISSRIQLVPLFSHPEDAAGACLKSLRFVTQVDVLRDVEKSRFLTLELIGDREGDYRAMTASEMASRRHSLPRLQNGQVASQTVSSQDPWAPPLHPVLHTAHCRAAEVSSWRIVATRKSACRMGVPASLAPLLTEEPRIEHPDYLRQQFRRTCNVVSNDVCASQLIEYDTSVKEKKWREHQKFRQLAADDVVEQDLVIRDYNAEFDRCGTDGQIYLRKLDEFREAVYERMRLLLSAHFPETQRHPSHFYGLLEKARVAQKVKQHQSCMNALLLSYLDGALVKKSIKNRLDLYVITPRSRNALLLHCREISAVTELISSFTWGILTKGLLKCRIAYHTTHSALLTEEPTELRELICNIILQLYPDSEIYRQAICEVDLSRLQNLFYDLMVEKAKVSDALSSSSELKQEGEKTITVVVLDGIDHIIPPVRPCAALRESDGPGKDTWETSPLRFDALESIPFCLSRNFRLVLGCETGSALYEQLSARGEDSVELLSVGSITPNDFDEMLRTESLAKIGVTLSDDEFMFIRQQEHALSPEYVELVVDVLRSFTEAPGIESQAIRASLPGTIEGMVQRVYDNLNESFGTALIRKCTRLLMCSRWGIHEPQLRSMLQLPCCRFNRLMRMMRPLLYSERATNIGMEGGNALNFRICIRSRAFRELIRREDVLVAGSENDHKVWHSMIVRQYLDVVRDVLQREKKQVLFSLSPTSPYERTAVKELPYHAVQAENTHIIHRLVLSMPFLMTVYRNSLGYHLVRELIEAFNSFHESFEVGEYNEEEDADVGGHKEPPSLLRLRDYIYFLRHYNARLTMYPHLVLETAVECSGRYPYVSIDAKAYVSQVLTSNSPLADRRLMFFTTVGYSSKRQIHQRSITACRILPRGTRVITASMDRSICAVQSATGVVDVQLRRAPSAIEKLLCCDTGAYHATICKDRTLQVYDSAEMQVVSRCDGGIFGAPLACVVFSARGRFYLVATEDLHLRVFDTEKSTLVLHVDQRQFLEKCEISDMRVVRGITAVIPDRSDDDVFYSTCHNVVVMWRLNSSRDAFIKERTFSTSFNVASGIITLSGTHFVLYPAPTVATSEEHLPPPRYVRICGVQDGGDVAVLTCPRSVVVYQVSSNEEMVASGLDDGSVVVHRIPWQQIREKGDGDKAPMALSPANYFTAYRLSTEPVVSDLRFKWNNDGLFALGNKFQIKYWKLPRKPRLTPAASENSIGAEHQGTCGEQIMEPEDEVIDGVADGEIVHHEEITAWDVAKASYENAAELVFGDSTGRLSTLRAWNPLL
uniref:Uncharacterized protein TCIL3000_9_5680 n=1 Tax=Trypanosoma congolense (strain IL3000) TaxID=1068625 RepID=G0UUU6_TRYCI|nr:unnamed protein product [Trypanosoma congolense IL3000]